MKLNELKALTRKRWNHSGRKGDFESKVKQFGDLRCKATWEAALNHFTSRSARIVLIEGEVNAAEGLALLRSGLEYLAND